MKSCLTILLVFFTFVAVVGGGVLIWYLSSTSEFTRTSAPKPPTVVPKAVPKAVPVR